MARMGSFSGDLKKFARHQGQTLDEAHRGICIKLFSSVVLDTPVEDGTLRANWNISNSALNDSVSYSKQDPTGAATTAKIRDHKMGAGDVTFLTNAMPYAEVAEYGMWNGPTDKVTAAGYSEKAPQGMVRKNVARIDSIIREATGEAKRKPR